VTFDLGCRSPACLVTVQQDGHSTEVSQLALPDPLTVSVDSIRKGFDTVL
jgi:hypothetical protein